MAGIHAIGVGLLYLYLFVYGFCQSLELGDVRYSQSYASFVCSRFSKKATTIFHIFY